MGSNMSISINKRTFPYSCVLVAILIVEMHFLGLFKLPSGLEFIVYTNRAKWVAPVALLMAYTCWKQNKNNIFYKYRGFLPKYLGWLVISLIIICIYTTIRYADNPLITTYGFAAVYLYAFLTIPIIYIFEEHGGIDGFFTILNLITAIMYVISILQGIYYMKTGGLLFGASDTEIIAGVMTRDGKIRYSAGAFSNIMLIYNFYRLYCNRNERLRKKSGSIAIIALALLDMHFTGQTRMALLSVLAAIFALILMGSGTKRNKIISTLIILATFIFIILSGTVTNFISSFSISSSNAGSTIARQYAWKYYFSEFLKNPIFGISFAGDENYYDLVHGNSGIYYQTILVKADYSDCGFIAQMAKLGIFSFLIYLWPIIHDIKICWRYIRTRTSIPGAMLTAFLLYLVFTSATLIIMDDSRIIGWPVMLAVFEYYFINQRDRTEIAK